MDETTSAHDRYGVPGGIQADGAAIEGLVAHRTTGIIRAYVYLDAKKGGVFKKERPLFGKKDIEAGRVVDLLFHIGLREVGMCGQVEHGIGSHRPLYVAAEFHRGNLRRLRVSKIGIMIGLR